MDAPPVAPPVGSGGPGRTDGILTANTRIQTPPPSWFAKGLPGTPTNAEDWVKNAMSKVVMAEVTLIPAEAAAHTAEGPQKKNLEVGKVGATSGAVLHAAWAVEPVNRTKPASKQPIPAADPWRARRAVVFAAGSVVKGAL